MSEVAVRDTLERIAQLPGEDRVLLDERLTELGEAEWRREAEAARAEARMRGIDQAAIASAAEELRYHQ